METDNILNKFDAATDEEKRALFAALINKTNQDKDTINHLEELVLYYKNIVFGKKSEKIKTDDGQLSLFNELEVEESINKVETQLEEIKGYTRRPKGSKNLVNDDINLPIEVIEHRKDNLICDKCGSPLKEIGYDTRKELCVKPAQYFIKEHRYFKYVCNNCSSVEQVSREVIPFPNSMYSSSLVAKFINDKFALSLPFYRQEQAFNDLGINIKRSNMVNYISKASDLIKPLYDKYLEILKSVDIIHSDETRLKILSEKNIKGDVKANYIWLFRSSRSYDKQIKFYYYNDGRKYSNVTELFINNNDNDKHYICADGYEAYEQVKGYKLVSCWAHARRKFVDALNLVTDASSNKYKRCKKYINKINELYSYENKYKNDHLSYEEIKEARNKDELPLIEEYFTMLEEDSLKVLPESKLGKAINYSLSRKESLKTYLEDGRLEIDNNQAEHLAKAYAVGRKNWLFCENPSGAEKSCIMYTIVQTAIANNLIPEDYLNWLLENIATTKLSEIEDLAPWSDKIPNNLKRTN